MLSPTAAQRVPPRWIGPVGLAETNSTLTVTPLISRTPAVVGSGLDDGAGELSRCPGREPNIEESGTGNLSRRDAGDLREAGRKHGRNIAGRFAGGLGHLHGNVRRPIPMLPFARTFYLRFGKRGGRSVVAGQGDLPGCDTLLKAGTDGGSKLLGGHRPILSG